MKKFLRYFEIFKDFKFKGIITIQLFLFIVLTRLIFFINPIEKIYFHIILSSYYTFTYPLT